MDFFHMIMPFARLRKQWQTVVLKLIRDKGLGYEIKKCEEVATATNSLFRSLGQMLGASVFGSYFNSRIVHHMATENLESADINQMNRLINPSGTDQLPPSMLSQLQHILVSSIHDVFIVFLGLAIVCVLATLLLPKSKHSRADSATQSH